jgi:hypothetical protein
MPLSSSQTFVEASVFRRGWKPKTWSTPTLPSLEALLIRAERKFIALNIRLGEPREDTR